MDDKNADFWGQVEAHLGYDREPPEHWTTEEKAAWYQGYDRQKEEQKAA